MKKTLFLLSFTFLSLIGFAQEGIWATVNNLETLYRSSEFQALNMEMVKAFPSSKSPLLQKVYEFKGKDNNCDLARAMSVLSTIDGVEGIEFSPTYETLGFPNDFSLVGYDYALNLINAPSAWDITTGNSGVVIGISDSNYDLNHQELDSKTDYISANIYGTSYTHGTAVAVMAAGNTNNNIGKSSIGYNSRLQLYAMNYNELLSATYNGCKIINASWAAGCYYSSYGQEVINEIHANGSIVVAAAGNGTTCNGASNLVYPAAYEHVIAVSSVGPSNNHERFIGNASSTHQHNASVDLVAPGYDVMLSTSDGVYMTGTGSSFATPLVSGTIALMLDVNPCLTAEQIEYILKQTADSIVYEVNPQYMNQLGGGRLDSYKAVLMASTWSTMYGMFSENVNCQTGEHFISVESLSGVEPYTYNWSTGSTSSSSLVDISGVISVIVKDAIGCVFSEYIDVEKYNSIKVITTQEDIKCFGGHDGSINVEIISGTQAQEPVWFDGYVGSTRTDLAPGTYYFTVLGAFGCQLSDSITISQPQPLTSTITYTNPTQTTFGSIDVQVNGGTEPYTYEWSNGSDIEDLNGLSDGFYELLITDNNNCLTSVNAVLETEPVDVASLNEDILNNISIYPNPSNGNVTIENANNIIVQTINGKLVEQFSNIKDKKINLTNLSSGVYLVIADKNTYKLVIN